MTTVALAIVLPTAAFVPLIPRRDVFVASQSWHASGLQMCELPIAGNLEDPVLTHMAASNAGVDTSTARASRRSVLRGAVWASGMYYSCCGGAIASASAYTISQVKPDEKATYAEAQKGEGPLCVLWVGAGDFDERSGVFKDHFLAGNEVIALDLRKPDAAGLRAATTYATEHGYRLRFEQGDATKLKYTDETFDAVVCSMFLSQDFNPVDVVSEIRRVLKPGGRFGFYEHVEDIDQVIVGKVFGDRSVIRVEAYPERTNVVAGVVRKV